jgi:flagellar hook-basal body complex protein FliE
MNINPVGSLLSTLQTQSITPSTPSPFTSTGSIARSLDASAISPTATFLNELSQLQQRNPSQFSQVLTRITNRLNQAAQKAASTGNSQQAAQFHQLAASLQSAASGGPLPTAQQLQQAGLTGL